MVVDEYSCRQEFAFDETGFVEGLFWNQFNTLTRNTK
jgi:hypothetical protein